MSALLCLALPLILAAAIVAGHTTTTLILFDRRLTKFANDIRDKEDHR